MIKSVPKIFAGKGKEYCEVSAEIENEFLAWLECCNLTRTDFLKEVDSKWFCLNYVCEYDFAEISMSNDNGKIGIPFIWERDKNIPFETFSVEAGLLLAYISSMCHSELTKQKFTTFIKQNCLNK